MGDFARVALPVAAAVAVPYIGGQMAYTAAQALSYKPLLVSSFMPSPWMVAANAGLAGLGQISALRQERTQQRAAQARSAAEARNLQDRYEREERNRRERLKAAVAAQRARFGASGLSSRGGSAAAVVSGLTQSVERDSADAAKAFGRQRASLLEASRPARRDNFQLFRKTVSPFLNLLADD